MNNHAARVQNLIAKVDLASAGPKKRAVILLLKVQPSACRIRFATGCPACRRKDGVLVTYQIPGITWRIRDKGQPDRESCGYFCPHCKFSNAGSRPVEE